MGEAKNPPPAPGPGNGSGNEPRLEIRRGPGRPPGSGTKPKAKPAPAPDPDPVEVRVEIDPELVADCFVALVEIGDEFWFRAILNAAGRKVPPDKRPAFIQEIQGARLNGKDKVAMQKAICAIVKKYAILRNWGPEIVLLVSLMQYNYRMFSLLSAVEKLPDLAPATLAKPAEEKKP